MSLVDRRRAIYTGLVRHLPEPEVMPILSFWEAHYAQKPAFALNEFLAEVVKRCSVRLERASLYRELISIMSGPSSGLLDDPLHQLEAWRQAAGLAPQRADPQRQQARQTFDALSSVLLAGLPALERATLGRRVRAGLQQVSAQRDEQLDLRSWLEQGQPLPQPDFSLEQWRRLLNLLYVGCCELLGPVQADQLLSHAVRQVAALDLPLAPQKLL